MLFILLYFRNAQHWAIFTFKKKEEEATVFFGGKSKV